MCKTINIIIKNMTLHKINDKHKKVIRKSIHCAIRAKKINIKKKLEVCISLVSNKIIQELNKKYINLDTATDVLSFGFCDFENIKNININKNKNKKKDFDLEKKVDKKIFLGDIIISLDKIKCYAIEYKTTFEYQLSFLTIHGFLHIMGLDHIEEADKEIMFSKQKKILKKVFNNFY
jgi:probable rRNA maturation factor